MSDDPNRTDRLDRNTSPSMSGRIPRPGSPPDYRGAAASSRQAPTPAQRKRIQRSRSLGLVLVLSLVLGLASGFFAGRAWPDKPQVSFYATVSEVYDTTMLVEGIPENDIHHRDKMLLVTNKLDKAGRVFLPDGSSIDLAELKPGDSIRVIYDGKQLETYPAQLQNVWRIEKTVG